MSDASAHTLSWEEWARCDALDLAALVARGEVTAEELARQAAAAVDLVDPSLNAVLEVFDDRLETLRDLPAAGPFRGVPYFLKDAGAALEGRLQECGSRLFEGCRAPATSIVTQRVLDAGLNPLGRSAVPELASTMMTESRLHGTTRNPWNLDRTPGGSSGGAAALVAAGVLPISQANDGGGSTRIPAAFCGNVGMKHSRGLVSLGPEANEYLAAAVSEGVNARSVRDVAAFLDAVKGPVPGESIPFLPDTGSHLAALSDAPASLRIGIWTDGLGTGAPDPEVQSRIVAVADHLSNLGHKLEACPFDFSFEVFRDAFSVLWQYMLSGEVGARIAELGRELRPDDLEPVLFDMLQRTHDLRVHDIVSMYATMNDLCRHLGGLLQRFDLLLSPVVPVATPAASGGPYSLSHADNGYAGFIASVMPVCLYTALANFTGRPAISLPLAEFEDGMPMGLQFLGDIGQDALLLRLAAQLEQSLPWRERRPALHVTRLAS